jgi:hypothetical protein
MYAFVRDEHILPNIYIRKMKIRNQRISGVRNSKQSWKDYVSTIMSVLLIKPDEADLLS